MIAEIKSVNANQTLHRLTKLLKELCKHLTRLTITTVKVDKNRPLCVRQLKRCPITVCLTVVQVQCVEVELVINKHV